MQWDPKIGWGLVATVSIFVAGYFIRWALDWLAERRQIRRYYVAMLHEVERNVEGIEKAVLSFPPLADINSRLAGSASYRPHFISTYSSKIFETNGALLTTLPSIVANDLISFYDRLEFIEANIAAFERKSFEVITQPGREAAVAALLAHFRETETFGRGLLSLIKRELKL